MKKTIRIKADSHESPDVMFMATALECDPDLVFGKLFRLHVWLENHGGEASADDSVIDRIVSMEGFAEALKSLHCIDEKGRLRLFHAEGNKKHNGARTEDPVKWTGNRWWGISQNDLQEWTEAYPACNVALQLKQMDAWLKANPRKAIKSEWRRFITNWLKRSQERGGDVLSHSPDGSSHTLNRLRENRND